jgi:hypothetical protein
MSILSSRPVDSGAGGAGSVHPVRLGTPTVRAFPYEGDPYTNKL